MCQFYKEYILVHVDAQLITPFLIKAFSLSYLVYYLEKLHVLNLLEELRQTQIFIGKKDICMNKTTRVRLLYY